MTRELVRKYLGIFSKMYPSRPALEVFEVYERALADVSDEDGTAACEICLLECEFFPMPRQILKRVRRRDDFVVTTAPGRCSLCGDTGWKLSGENGTRFAVLCECPPESQIAEGDLGAEAVLGIWSQTKRDLEVLEREKEIFRESQRIEQSPAEEILKQKQMLDRYYANLSSDPSLPRSKFERDAMKASTEKRKIVRAPRSEWEEMAQSQK